MIAEWLPWNFEEKCKLGNYELKGSCKTSRHACLRKIPFLAGSTKNQTGEDGRDAKSKEHLNSQPLSGTCKAPHTVIQLGVK